MINRRTGSYKFLAAFIIGCFFIWSCENDFRAIQKLNQKAIGIEEGKQIESFLSQDGKVKAKLMAPLMLRALKDTPKVEFPKSLKVDFFDDSAKIESKLSAKYGRYLENENKVFLRDSVVVFNVKGDTLFCKELYWDQVKATFYTEKNVIIHQPNQKLLGKGMIADQGFKWFTILHPYNSYIKVPDSSFVAE